MDRSRSVGTSSDRSQRDIGTLWTLKRGESTVLCSLSVISDGLELRVVMDGTILRSDRCDRHEKAFELAERWRMRMIDRGWMKVMPGADSRAGGRVST